VKQDQMIFLFYSSLEALVCTVQSTINWAT